MSFFKKKTHPGDSTTLLQNTMHPDDEDSSPPVASWSSKSYRPLELADLNSTGSGAGNGKSSLPTIGQGLSTILGLKNIGSNNQPPLTNKTTQRRYFFNQFCSTSRAKVFTAKAYERPANFVHEERDVLTLPHDTSAFRFDAEFERCLRGYYDVVWKIQPTHEFQSPNGFHFTVNVAYEDDPDASGSMEIALGQHTLQDLAKGKWHYLILEERLVIHPHTSRARVWLSLSNNENQLGQHYSGLLIEHIELRPAGTKVHTPGVFNVVVRDGPRPVGTVDTSEAPLGTEHISRLAFSEDSEYLAALTLLEDSARVQVWSLLELRSLRGPRCNASKMGAVTQIYHPGIQDLAIGLTISASGDQVAVFQEPRIGDWQDGSEIPKSSFPFTLFLNPLVQQESVVVDVDSVKSAPARVQSGPDGPKSPRSQKFTPQSTGPLELIPFSYNSDHLNNIVGYCAFLSKSKENEDLDSDGNASGGDSHQNKAKSVPKFVACNGYYIDVFTIDGTRWKHHQTITVSNLTPTYSRRITCKIMFDAISPNMFMWLEDEGLNCSTWGLLTGANVSHIHSLENASFKDSSFRGHNKIAISPHESIVALASVDGSLTTYFVKSGMAIDDRKFPGYKIEYVGFHSQDDQLLVVLRDTGTSQLSARVLDSLQLRSEVEAYQVPIPTIGSAIVCYMKRRSHFGRGVVCSTIGSRLRFHWTQAANSSKVDKSSEDNRAEPTETEFESVFDESITFRLNTTPIRISSPEGDGKPYWLQRVELLEVSVDTQIARLVFAFAPEPWTRCPTPDFTNPEGLINAYFMPCGTRFVVVGIQTIQIWNLPRPDEPRVSLQFIFSKPVEDPSMIENPKFVGDYYERFETATFYQDITNRTALLEMTTNSSTKLKNLAIPGPFGAGARLAIPHAFRSVHLLAATYMFAIRDHHVISNQFYYPFTFEEHADGIARFVKSHINRMSSLNNLYPWEFTPGKEESKRDPSRKKQDVTSILSSLLDERHLRETNSSFIMHLLSTSNGEWIPRDHKHLNPILRAIARRDRLLVQTLLDYCVANAKKYHPSYMMPAVQCVDELAERYPDMLAELFRRASYIPAHNYAYVATHAIVANPHLRFRFWKDKSQEYTDYAKPVFHLRSQLPTRNTKVWFTFENVESSYSSKRIKAFPESDAAAQRLREERVAAGKFNHKIYVAPFPKFSTYGPYIRWYTSETPESPFSRIAGMNFFDSPAMTAILEFKWHKFAFKYWSSVTFVLLAYYGIFLVLTGFQIKNYVDVKDDQEIEYHMDMSTGGWGGVIKFDIALGILMLLLELSEFAVNGLKYFASPYNYIDVLAKTLPLISCFKLLHEKAATVDPENFVSQQMWWISFSILAIYMHILFEFRVVKQLGIVVNTIVKMTLRTVWFLLVMALFIVGFTHALLHLLHTRSRETDYPTSPLLALSSTYFFLGGRWDPLDNNFDDTEGSFHVMMFLFFFFTAILLLNLLIALMNDAYNDSQQEGEQAWLKQWSEIMATVERCYLSPSQMHNSNLFPDYVYYGASAEEAEAYEAQFTITSKSNLSIENQYLMDQITGEQKLVQATHRTIQRDVSNLHHNYERLRRAQESVQRNMLTITALVGHCYRILENSPQELPAGENDEHDKEQESTDDEDRATDEEFDGEDYDDELYNEEVSEADDEEEEEEEDEDDNIDNDGDRESRSHGHADQSDDQEPALGPDAILPSQGAVFEERLPLTLGRKRKESTDTSESREGIGSPARTAPATIPLPPPPPPSSMGPRPPANLPSSAPPATKKPPVLSSPSAPVLRVPPPSSSDRPFPTSSSPGSDVTPIPAAPQTTSPTTASPTELEQIGSPTPISEPLSDPAPAPPNRRFKKAPAATTPAPGAPAATLPAPASQPVRINPVPAAPRHTHTTPGRTTYVPPDIDPSSSPYGALPAQPSRVTYDYGQLPGPSTSLPVSVGHDTTGWSGYQLPHQRPQGPWNQATNPAEMQARIESLYRRRKKRKNASKAVESGAVTDASSAAEDDAASLRSLQLQDSLVSSSFTSGSQPRQRRRQQAASGSTSTPSTLPRGLDRRELLARTLSDTAAQDQLMHRISSTRRTPLAESHVFEQQTSQPSDHIEYLDMEDEHAI